MKVIIDGYIREANEEQIALEEKIKEDAKLFITETAKDLVEEFIDRLAEVNSITDIIKLAKDIRAKRGGIN